VLGIAGTMQEKIARLNLIFGSAESSSTLPITRMNITNFVEEDNIKVSMNKLLIKALV